jgi:hypothetical protein
MKEAGMQINRIIAMLAESNYIREGLSGLPHFEWVLPGPSSQQRCRINAETYRKPRAGDTIEQRKTP